MLRSSKLRGQAVNTYICWQCSARSTHTRAVRPTASTAKVIVHAVPKRKFETGRASRANIEFSIQRPSGPPVQVLNSSFRESLRQWEVENLAAHKSHDDSIDNFKHGEAVNGFTQLHGGELLTEPDELELDDDTEFAFTPDQLVDVGQSRSFLLPGDLVELVGTGNRQQELAVFIRHIDKQSQFYTMSGRWVHRSQGAPKFFTPDFFKADELLPLIPFLPSEPVEQKELEKLHGFDVALPRHIGRPLIQKLTKFWSDADKVYQSTFERLDRAHDILAHPDRFSYATLQQITEKLLSKGSSIKKDQDGKYPMHVQYAVHRKLLSEDIGFHAQERQVIRNGALYEINSKAEILSIRTTMETVRRYRAALTSLDFSKCIAFTDFLRRARKRIDLSRTFRDFTPYGTIGPSKIQSEEVGEHYRVGRKGEPWKDNDFEFIEFMESWACMQSFRLNSVLSGIGSEILRALGRYNDVDLGSTTAFTFMKEIGVIPPWENKAAYILRLPYTGRRLGVEYGYTPHTGFTADKVAHLRKDWKDLPVYCIDDQNAHEIDDGISVEATNNPDEYWIHVHVADPAAHMDPKGAAAQYAEYVTETIYFPERRVPMLHEDKVAHDFSLAPNRPCLTFSSRLNINGEVIDTAITPGFIRNVTYMTNSLVQEVTTGTPEREYNVYGDTIDIVPSSHLQGRPLLSAEMLSTSQKADLAILHRLSAARSMYMQNKGGVSLSPDRASLSVSFDGAPWTKPKSRHSYWRYGDPKIKLSVPKGTASSSEFSVVVSCMLLAGECAAKWCAARNIPITYRITPQQPDKDPSRFYEEHVRPYRDRNEEIPVEVLGNYFNTIGKVQPSIVPGPHVAIGADMITRCTSPLRRYSDLVVAWQIEAALLEEARTGKSLVGNTEEIALPFTKEKLESMLPRISHREKFISHSSSRAERFWTTQFLVYAWKFEKYAKLPSPLYFRIRSINDTANSSGGVLTDLAIGGQMFKPQWIKRDDFKIDDLFEVEIEHVDVCNQVAHYKAVRRIESEGVAVNDSAETVAH